MNTRDFIRNLFARLRTLTRITRLDRGRIATMVLGFLAAALIFGLLGGEQREEGAAAGEHDGHERGAEAAAAVETAWTCSMHPQIRQPEPGQCPICGMDLIPSGAGNEGSDNPARVVLSERAKALAKLRTSKVVRRQGASGNLRLLGRIEPNEESLRSVTAWTGGRIDRLHVNVTGQKVHAGQVIASLYSPEVFAAHQDLIVAKKQVERLAQGAETSQRAAQAALGAARERLRLIGVPDDELARMEKKSSPTRSVPIRTPFGGTIMDRIATEGAYVATGAPLFKVANLRKLWVQLDAYETDLPLISVGQEVAVTVEALPGEEFLGSVTFIDPTLDSMRRTARVRVEVDNESGHLRPGMFASANVAAAEPGDATPLVIPATAPLFTGRRAIVYVEITEPEQTAYEARTVRLGPRLEGVYPVVAGLSEGERVVSRGAFALDADLQIRGGASMMTHPDDTQPGAWDEAVVLAPEDRKKLEPVVLAYLSLQKALAEDSLTDAQTAAGVLQERREAVAIARPAAAMAAWSSMSEEMKKHGHHVVHAKDLEQARSGFEGVSLVVQRLLGTFGNPTEKSLSLAYCPMAMGSEGASWVQEGEAIDNSYFGESMRDCGEVKKGISPGAFLGAADSKPAIRSAPAGGHQH